MRSDPEPYRGNVMFSNNVYDYESPPRVHLPDVGRAARDNNWQRAAMGRATHSRRAGMRTLMRRAARG